MKTYDVIIKFLHDLEKDIQTTSYQNLLDKKELVKEKLQSSGCVDIVKEDIKTFLDILTKDKFYMGQLVLNDIAYNITFIHGMFLMCLYFDRLDAYRNLSSYLSIAVEKLDIIEYKGITEGHLDIILKKTFNIQEGMYDGHKSFEIKPKFKNSEKYDAYEKRYNPSGPNDLNDNNDKFIWAEHRTLDDEYSFLKDYSQERHLVWVAKDYGDGFGYDVLSIDPFTQREKLIEVKARTSDFLELTENEVRVMREANQNNADYYVYRYTLLKGYFALDTLKYDPTIDELIDQEGYHYVIDGPYPSKVNSKGEVQFEYKIKNKDKVKSKNTNNN